jgi:hypothetical protein
MTSSCWSESVRTHTRSILILLPHLILNPHLVQDAVQSRNPLPHPLLKLSIQPIVAFPPLNLHGVVFALRSIQESEPVLETVVGRAVDHVFEAVVLQAAVENGELLVCAQVQG